MNLISVKLKLFPQTPQLFFSLASLARISPVATKSLISTINLPKLNKKYCKYGLGKLCWAFEFMQFHWQFLITYTANERNHIWWYINIALFRMIENGGLADAMLLECGIGMELDILLHIITRLVLPVLLQLL